MSKKVKKKIEYKGNEIRVENVSESVMIDVRCSDSDKHHEESWFVRSPSLIERIFGITMENKVREKIKVAKDYIDNDLISEMKEEDRIYKFVKEFDLNKVWEEIK